MKVEAEGHEEEDISRLRALSAFDKFSDDELNRLVRASHHTSHKVPWPLIREQTPSDACFILLKGKVGVYVGDDQIAELGAGEVIGESALRQGKLRSATVTTIGPAEVLRIERDDLARLLEQIPALRDMIESTAAQHVASTPPPKPKPERTKLSTVPASVLERFEQAADSAGVSHAAALEDALTQWSERNGKA